MASFYDPNNDVEIKYPSLSKEQLYCEIELEQINEIVPIIKTQVEFLNDLLLTQEFNIYSPYLEDIIEDELIYINQNYFNLHNFDEMLDNEIQTRLVFSYIYELIVIDLIEDIIPGILKSKNCKSKDLLLIDLADLKFEIFKFLKKRLTTFNQIKHNIENEISEFAYNNMKYTYYFDLFDSDLENFKNNLLNPILIKYEDEIDCKVTQTY